MEKAKLSDMEELDEEPGEVIESAPPMKVGKEREINNSGVKKKLLKRGIGREIPEFGDEVTVRYGDHEQPFAFKLGNGQVVKGLDVGITTMKMGEIALFTLPPEMGYDNAGREGVPGDSIVQFEVELLSWIRVVDICKDGGIIKRILEKGQSDRQPSELDEVLVKYEIMLPDGSIAAKTAEEGVEFYIKDGHLIPGFPKAIKTMRVGEKANLNVQPQFRYIAKLEDGTIFEKKGFDGEASLEFITDEGGFLEYKVYMGCVLRVELACKYCSLLPIEQVIPGLDQAAATMKKGERAILTIKPEYGFRGIEVKRNLATVPPSSTLLYEIEMVDFVKGACADREVTEPQEERIQAEVPEKLVCNHH